MSSDEPARPVVLIVDRREDIRDLYGDWFTSLGFDVICTGTSKGALAVLERYSAHLVVMDLCVSESEGLQAIQQLQSDPLTRSIRVLALTASGDANSLMGTVKLTRTGPDYPSMSGSHCWSAGTRHVVPHQERAGS